MSQTSKNAYEAGSQKLIPAVLLYAFYENEVLMIHRNQKQNDFHEGKWNGLGGKFEPGESSLDCAVREFEEESGCKTSLMQWNWLGHLNFPNFKPKKNEDWSVTVFVTELNPKQKNEVIINNEEGTLHWIPSAKVLTLPLWAGDHIFMPHVLSKTPFEGTFFYHNEALERFICNPILR